MIVWLSHITMKCGHFTSQISPTCLTSIDGKLKICPLKFTFFSNSDSSVTNSPQEALGILVQRNSFLHLPVVQLGPLGDTYSHPLLFPSRFLVSNKTTYWLCISSADQPVIRSNLRGVRSMPLNRSQHDLPREQADRRAERSFRCLQHLGTC